MTKEEALNYLKSSGFSKEQIQAIVEALKQEPCNDCVSREAVFDWLCEGCERYHWNGDNVCLTKCEDYRTIAKLPPVQPKQKWIADNATNGDVIMAMFDCMVIDISDGEVCVEKIYFPFDEEWWNAPYKEG